MKPIVTPLAAALLAVAGATGAAAQMQSGQQMMGGQHMMADQHDQMGQGMTPQAMPRGEGPMSPMAPGSMMQAPMMRGPMGPGMMAPGMMMGGMMEPGMMMGMEHHHGASRLMMQVMFAMVDTDGDGALSVDEVLAVHRRLFAYADADHDGKLTPEELRGFLRQDEDEDAQ